MKGGKKRKTSVVSAVPCNEYPCTSYCSVGGSGCIDNVTDPTMLWAYFYDKCNQPAKKKSRNNALSEEIQVVEYEVAEIMCHWFVKNSWHYEVRWEGYVKSNYEPSAHLMNSIVLIAEYYTKTFGNPSPFDKEKVYTKLIESVDLEKFDGKKNEHLHECLNDLGYSVAHDFSYKDIDKTIVQINETFMAAVQCVTLMNQVKKVPQDQEIRSRATKLAVAKCFGEKRLQQLTQLQYLERLYCSIEEDAGNAPLTIENNVDLEVLNDFTYIGKMVAGDNVSLEDYHPEYCTCEDGCGQTRHCCNTDRRSQPYTKKLTLKPDAAQPIFECNNWCACPPDCRKRVVQHGRKIPLCIYKTQNMGWGVKAMKRVPAGSFLCEYIGEMITAAVSNVREIEYSRTKQLYVFDLDYDLSTTESEYSVDATKTGNVARFINHSCSPNAHVKPVIINLQNPKMHKLCLFSMREIKAGEEITFNYRNSEPSFGSVGPLGLEFCQCGSIDCYDFRVKANPSPEATPVKIESQKPMIKPEPEDLP